jgi:hypothetical protein|tara:strand:+ start:906 stop:1259 length:354 start_codon:yes stop_codon:yes gene_type:complete
MAWRFNDFPGNIAGSVFTKASSDAIKPPAEHVFVAFTTLAATTFDASGGLVAETATRFANTEDAAGDAAGGSEVYAEGSGGLQIGASDSIAAGITIYGNYTEIDVNSGSIIAYYAKK